jgi:hypothetical protein
MNPNKRIEKRILAAPLIRDNSERSEWFQELNINRKEFVGIKN